MAHFPVNAMLVKLPLEGATKVNNATISNRLARYFERWTQAK